MSSPSLLPNVFLDTDLDPSEHTEEAIHEPRLWRDNRWTARVIKNEDDDGWAVEMTRSGKAEPALVGPWTMGRDKKNPKPLDTAAFNVLVKTAAEVVRRHEQQRDALLHKRFEVNTDAGRVIVTLDVVADEDEPHAWLAAHGLDGKCLARRRVAPNYSLNNARAAAWVADGLG